MSTRSRVTIPAAIKPNDVIEVKTLINHVMETGQRKDKDGTPIPRNIINTMKALFRGRTVFSADLHPGTAANPFIGFHLRIAEPGELIVIWTDDKGQSTTERVDITIL